MAQPSAFANDRAKKTLYVTGFDPKLTKKHVLEELFTQGGPVKEVKLFETHAFILFHHEESVPYCLALFNELELHGQRLRLNPRHRTKETFCYMKYLSAVRKKLMSEYRKLPPPDLPPKQVNSSKKRSHQRSGNRKPKTDQAKAETMVKAKLSTEVKDEQTLKPVIKQSPKQKINRTPKLKVKKATKSRLNRTQTANQVIRRPPNSRHNQTSASKQNKTKKNAKNVRKFRKSK